MGSMPSLEMYLEVAPECAQRVLNQWGRLHQTGVQWTEEFDTVLNLACNYCDAKEQRKQYERLETIRVLEGMLDAEIAEAKADEASKQRAFVEAYKALRKNRVRCQPHEESQCLGVFKRARCADHGRQRVPRALGFAASPKHCPDREDHPAPRGHRNISVLLKAR